MLDQSNFAKFCNTKYVTSPFSCTLDHLAGTGKPQQNEFYTLGKVCLFDTK